MSYNSCGRENKDVGEAVQKRFRDASTEPDETKPSRPKNSSTSGKTTNSPNAVGRRRIVMTCVTCSVLTNRAIWTTQFFTSAPRRKNSYNVSEKHNRR